MDEPLGPGRFRVTVAVRVTVRVIHRNSLLRAGLRLGLGSRLGLGLGMLRPCYPGGCTLGHNGAYGNPITTQIISLPLSLPLPWPLPILTLTLSPTNTKKSQQSIKTNPNPALTLTQTRRHRFHCAEHQRVAQEVPACHPLASMLVCTRGTGLLHQHPRLPDWARCTLRHRRDPLLASP